MVYHCRQPQTHCRKGHAMVGDNVILRKDGYLRCRICLREVKRRWAAKDLLAKREARLAARKDAS